MKPLFIGMPIVGNLAARHANAAALTGAAGTFTMSAATIIAAAGPVVRSMAGTAAGSAVGIMATGITATDWNSNP